MARSPFPSLRLFALCLLLPLSMAGCYNLTGQSGDDDTVGAQAQESFSLEEVDIRRVGRREDLFGKLLFLIVI